MAWINGYQDWLSESQSLKNAQEVVNFLYADGKDWSKESICGLIGNMRHESSINPNMYEYGYDWGADRGFGLVQWTPRSKFWNWGSGQGYSEDELRSGDSQLARIDYEVDNNIQWIAKDSNFNGLTFKQFRTNSKNLSVNQLTEAFTWGYERPNQQAGEESMPARQAFANKAFNDLDWSGGGDNGGGGSDPEPPPLPEKPDVPDFSLDNILDYFQEFVQELIDKIEKMLIVNLYDYGKSKTFGNTFLKVDETFSNFYKIKPTINFKKIIDDLVKSGNEQMAGLLTSALDDISDTVGGIIDDIFDDFEDYDPNPDPDPEPNNDMYFPVNINQAGINFWVKSNHSSGSTAYDMGYGTRSNGRFHAGYDIGTGGNAGYKAYAIRDCTITDIRQVSGGGYSIFMDHDTDDYHSMFLHLVQDSAVVSVGDKVKAGEQVAVIGATGGNYAIHLHVEISPTGEFHTEENTINPEKYLKVTGDNQTSLKIPK